MRRQCQYALEDAMHDMQQENRCALCLLKEHHRSLLLQLPLLLWLLLLLRLLLLLWLLLLLRLLLLLLRVLMVPAWRKCISSRHKGKK